LLSEFEIMYRVHKKINELYETNPTLWNNFQKVEKTIDKPTEEKYIKQDFNSSIENEITEILKQGD
jgi:hypothetical protein